MPIPKSELLATLPPEWPEDLLFWIRDAVRASGRKLVVLDDDPTGTQTVHNVTVLTDASVKRLIAALRAPDPVVYVLTNTRSLPLAQAQALNREIAHHLQAARDTTGRKIAIVSRSDSTLRGHYPGETDALATALGDPFDATVIVPFFVEGGRITAHDTHYVTEGDLLIPASETEYARDAVFGYRHANLRAWVSEKHGERMASAAVDSVSLDVIRRGGPPAVLKQLAALNPGQVCVVNAVSYRDLEVVVAALMAAEAQGQRFLYRTAASFVRVRGGIAPQPLLTPADLRSDPSPAGGLIIIGSHVSKTTQQMVALQALPGVTGFEVAVADLINPHRQTPTVQALTTRVERTLQAGEDALVYTSRAALTTFGDLTGLEIGRRVSRGLTAIVAGLVTRPAWVIAKGGITASDVATEALRIRRAEVMGQAIPGVPIWQTKEESRWPNLIYVVFPGNVGDSRALARMVCLLRGET